MSEYQWVHFLAIDSPLDNDQLEFMEAQSTRAEIDRREFTNEYHYGDFRGDADEMLRRGYDVHLHFANFGIRTLKFRLPKLPFDKRVLRAFSTSEALSWQKDRRGTAGILTISPYGDADGWDFLDDPYSLLERLVPVRDQLTYGDLRPLYLFWLGTSYDPDQLEPPVPAGLGETHDAFDAICEFFEIPFDLVELSAETAPQLPKRKAADQLIHDWLKRQTKSQLLATVEELLTDESARGRRLNEIRQSSVCPPWPTAKPSRTLGDLQLGAEQREMEMQEAERLAERKKGCRQ